MIALENHLVRFIAVMPELAKFHQLELSFVLAQASICENAFGNDYSTVDYKNHIVLGMQLQRRIDGWVDSNLAP